MQTTDSQTVSGKLSIVNNRQFSSNLNDWLLASGIKWVQSRKKTYSSNSWVRSQKSEVRSKKGFMSSF